MTRSEFLDEVKQILGNRDDVHGQPFYTFNVIADFWSVYFKQMSKNTLDRKDVALMMILFKVAREMNASSKDNWLDIAGYATCGAEDDKQVEIKNGEIGKAYAEFLEEHPLEYMSRDKFEYLYNFFKSEGKNESKQSI